MLDERSVIRASGCSRRAPVATLTAALTTLAMAVVASACGSSSSTSGSPGVPRFVEVTDSGIGHQYTGGFEYFVGGGVAAFDCSGDERPDLYFAGGESPAALYVDAVDADGNIRFEQRSSPVTDLTAVTGAYPLDIDSDGILDLVVLRRGENEVLRGLGACGFEPANDSLGIDGGDSWTTAFSASWEGTNRLPTLAFGNYLTLDNTACDDSSVVRPAASGTGYATPLPLTPGFCTLSMLFSDWGRSGQRDLRLANDRHYYVDGEEQLWRVAPGEVPQPYTEDDGWRTMQLWGMGIASQDVTGDGYPEVFVTSQGDNKLQTLEDGPSRPTYRDMALRAGVTAQRPYTGGDVLPSTAWHPEFEDVDNDGILDLFVTKGNVEAQPDFATRDPNDLLMGRADGTFVESGEVAGIVDFDRSRGAALVDLDLDGLLDLVVVERAAPVKVWRNMGDGADSPSSAGHWVSFRVRQPAPNVDAVGAWVEVRSGDRVVSRELTSGGGHVGGKLGWVHFGLGDAESAEVRVQWPDGEQGTWMSFEADGFLVLDRGSSGPTPWAPAG